MNWKSHLIVALTLYAVIVSSLSFFGQQIDYATLIAGALITITYGLLPDIDLENSKINNIVEELFLGSALFGLVSYFILKKWEVLVVSTSLVGLVLATKFLRHRGFTHTIRFGIIASAPLYLASPVYALFAFLAFLSHLAADLHLKI